MSVAKIVTLCHSGNTLKFKLIIAAAQSQQKETVRSEYQIRKIIDIKLRIDRYHEETIVFAWFSRIYDDEIRYVLNVTSKDFQLNNKTYFTDPSEQYLGTLKGSQALQPVLVEIILYIAPRVNMFASLHSDTDLTDFELRAVDGSVGFHKVVLSCSPVFRTMFSGKWKENKEGYMDIKDATRTTLQHLKDYVYLQVLPDSGVEQLLQIACCYLMAELKQRCIERLLSSLTVHNTWDLVQLAAAQDLPQLFGQLILFLNQDMIQNIGTHYAFNRKQGTD